MTTIPPIESIISPKQAYSTINPFYFGFNFKKTTTRKPFYNIPSNANQNSNDSKDFGLNQLQTSSSTVHPQWSLHSISTAHTPLVSFLPLTMTTSSNAANEPTIAEIKTSSPESNQFLTSFRNPVFDIYLKRVASTTKNPYNFGNFGQYFKPTTTIPTPFSLNLLGASNNFATFNTTSQRQKNDRVL